MKENTFPEAVYYYFKEWQEYNMEIHKHKAIEIMYVIKGKCAIEIDNTMVELRKQQYIFIYGNVPHRLIVEKKSPCRMLNVEFEWKENTKHFTSIHNLMKHDQSLKEMLTASEDYFILKDNGHIYGHLSSLVLELDLQNSDNRLQIDMLFIQLLLSVAKSRKEQMQQIGQSNEWVIHQVLTYIHENYDYEIRTCDLAKLVHLHPSYLHRIFKKMMKITINGYITKVRMEKAKMLLTKTDIPVTEIANYVGINTSQYFSNLFKIYTTFTPSQYRKEGQNFIGEDNKLESYS
ncbi:helix-turn-helix domain-containing protein [Oceanobacillus oncorhynchi subsp. oncorhynchi]|uniref:helix-turn-helix domain-containing protein n=1 Tax=Oceanobacillus oncorhynchi TaxID=545501 RepID=UPI003643029A